MDVAYLINVPSFSPTIAEMIRMSSFFKELITAMSEFSWGPRPLNNPQVSPQSSLPLGVFQNVHHDVQHHVLNTVQEILAASEEIIRRYQERGSSCIPTATLDRVPAISKSLWEEVILLPVFAIGPLHKPLTIYILILVDILHILSSSGPVEVSDDTLAIDHRLDDFLLQFQEALDFVKGPTSQHSSPNSTHFFQHSHHLIISGGNFGANTHNLVVHDPVVRDPLTVLSVAGVALSKLPKPGKVFDFVLSQWRFKLSKIPEQVGTNDDSASDVVKNNESEHAWTTCWIAAEHALQHARNNMLSVSKIFDKWQINKSEYVVHAGFDESLIKSHVGYLEQIHVFVFTEVDATSPLLSELGRLFSPFSSILFTESSSYRLPVFKDDGSVWEFDELTYFTASKFADGGSNSKTPLTIINLSQTPSQADGTTGFSQSSSGSGEGEKNEKRRLEKGKERDMGDKDEADKGSKDDKDPSDDPDDPPGDGDGIIARQAKISFEIASEIHPIQDEWNVFQTLTTHGSLTIKTTPLVQNSPLFSERFVQFTELTFDTRPPTDIAYKQFHLRVVIDSQQENAHVKVIKPKRTSESNGEEKQSSLTTSSLTRGMTAGLTLGPHPQAAITSNAMKTNEETTGSEKKRYNSAISEQHGDGNVQWGFNIDDVNLQKWGIDMPEDVLPTVCFEFVGDSDEPAPPPKWMDIAIISYWSMIIPREPKNTWIHKLFRFFAASGRSTGNTTPSPSYSNLFQVVALKADLANLPKPSRYRAKVKVCQRSGVSDHPDVKRRAADSVHVTPAVVDDPRKLSTFNLPNIAEFRLSDFPIMENLGCDSNLKLDSGSRY